MLTAIIFGIDALLIIGYILLRIVVKRRERKLHLSDIEPKDKQ